MLVLEAAEAVQQGIQNGRHLLMFSKLALDNVLIFDCVRNERNERN